VPPKAIPIIDLFAGPGGLSEGFSRFFEFVGGSISFQTRLAIEKDPVAAETLTLRSFFRQFDHRSVPDDYYKVIRRELPVSALEQFREWDAAQEKVWNVELGAVEEGELHTRIKEALNGAQDWILLGGPPCQAYSLMGRARMTGIGAAARKANDNIEGIRTQKRTLFDGDRDRHGRWERDAVDAAASVAHMLFAGRVLSPVSDRRARTNDADAYGQIVWS
jgi:DNA (cytosine-5)-methyltransferase 1